jgi:SAM-dependent methyltransferase
MSSNSLWHGLRDWWSGGQRGDGGALEAHVQRLTKRVDELAASNVAIGEQQQVIAHEVHASATLALAKSQSSLREIGAKLDELSAPEFRTTVLQSQTVAQQAISDLAAKVDALAVAELRATLLQSQTAAQQAISDLAQRLGGVANEVNAVHNAVLLQKQENAALAATLQAPNSELQALGATFEALSGKLGALHAHQIEHVSGLDQRLLGLSGLVTDQKNATLAAVSERLDLVVPAANNTQSGALLQNLGEIEARAAARDGAMSNEVNAILNTARPIFDRVNELDVKLTQLRNDVDAMRAFDTRHNLLATRGMAALVQGRPQQASTFKHVSAALPVASLEEQMAGFKKKAPANFAAWLAAYVAGVEEGQRASEGNLSHEGHQGAEYFRMFVNIHGVGRVLDVGCGPLSVPSYLADWPTTHLAGIDPQQPFTPHPFAFAQTFAETLPWPDASFETVVIGTSLDHVYLLDRSLDEIKRVLTPNGRLLIWTGMFENTRAYDPYAAAYQPPDAYHLFHPGKNWFYDLFARDYRLIERLETVAMAEFLAFERIARAGQTKA